MTSEAAVRPWWLCLTPQSPRKVVVVVVVVVVMVVVVVVVEEHFEKHKHSDSVFRTVKCDLARIPVAVMGSGDWEWVEWSQ